MMPENTSLTQKAEMAKCPSCHRTMVLPAFSDLNKLQRCPLCNAMSRGAKWLNNKPWEKK